MKFHDLIAVETLRNRGALTPAQRKAMFAKRAGDGTTDRTPSTRLQPVAPPPPVRDPNAPPITGGPWRPPGVNQPPAGTPIAAPRPAPLPMPAPGSSGTTPAATRPPATWPTPEAVGVRRGPALTPEQQRAADIDATRALRAQVADITGGVKPPTTRPPEVAGPRPEPPTTPPTIDPPTPPPHNGPAPVQPPPGSKRQPGRAIADYMRR